MTRIGDAIRSQRVAVAMQQNELARRAELSPQYVCDIETGKRLPPFDTVLDIANVFPEVDSAAWLVLLLRDLWGSSVVNVMARYFVAQSRQSQGGSDAED